MSATATQIQPLDMTLWHAGQRLELAEAPDLACDEGSAVWSARLLLDAAADYARLRVGDALRLEVGAVTVALCVDRLHHSRGELPAFEVGALSPVALLGAPYVAPARLGAVGMARAVCERLLAQALDWRLPNWRLPESAAELEGTPLEMASRIVAAAGGALESRLDGSLLVRPLGTARPPAFAGVEAIGLSDDHLYLATARIDGPLDANRLVISSGDNPLDAAARVQVETLADADDPHAYTVRAYPLPWRPLTLVHTGDAATAIGPRAEVARMETELLEVVAGQARARYPVRTLTASRWQYADLGAVRAGDDAYTLSAGDADGYSLLDLTYDTRAWQWRVFNARVETIQFLVVE